MAARVWQYWHEQDDLSKVYGTTGEGAYRIELAARECADFALVRDVAEAYKHGKLGRPGRRITRYDQTSARAMGFGEGAFGEGTFGGSAQLVVTLDDGSKRPLSAIMANVIAMWESLLQAWGL